MDQTQDQPAWQLRLGKDSIDDPLLGCLIMLTKIEHKPATAELLTSGLPLEQGALTPHLFIRAAERVNLSAKIVKRDLSDISPLVLPAVLLLKNRGACLLVAIKKNGIAKIVQPESGGGIREIKLEQLATQYEGFAIFTRPQYTFDDRSAEGFEKKSKVVNENWFWDVMYKIIPFYSHIILASVLINIFAISSPLFTMNVYDRVVPNHAFETLTVLAVGMLIVYGFDFLMKMLRGYFIDVAGKKADVMLSAKIYEQMMSVKMEARPESVGSFANNISAFDSFREFITSSTLAVIIDLPFLFLFVIVIYSIGGITLAIVPCVVFPVILISSLIIQALLNKHIKESYRFSAEKQSLLIESLIGIENIKAVNAESPMQKRWEHVSGMASKKAIKIKILSMLATNITTYAQQLSGVVMVILGVVNIIEGHMTMGSLIACNMLSSRALAPLGQIASLLTRYEQAMTSLKGVDGLMKMPIERQTDQMTLSVDDLSGYIEFQHVSFAYPKQETPCIDNFSLKIRPGEKIAIIGKIGSGKSTLEKLLLGLYEAQEGTILFDGVESHQLDANSIRRHIGYVPQDIVLFYGSVKDNIVVGAPYADDRDIFRAASLAGVGEFIAKHPKGFDMPVGERGSQLSGGQRQSIAIARALLLDPKIILLDEPTNMMDIKTENMFIHRMAPYLVEKTLILVTHNFNLLQLVDRVVIIEEGAVKVDGPKDAVLKGIAEGRY